VLPGRRLREFLARRVKEEEGPIVDGDGRELGRHTGFWRFTPGQRKGIGVSADVPLYALGTSAATNTVVVGPREALARTSVGVRSGRLFVPVDRVQAKLPMPLPRRPAAAGPRPAAPPLLDEGVWGSHRVRQPCSLDDAVWQGPDLTRGLSRLPPMPLAFEAIDALWIALSVFFVLTALGLTYLLIRLGGTVGKTTSFLDGLEREVLPVINESGGTLQRVNAQLDKADLITDSAVDIADSADTAVRAVSFAITRPVQLVAGLARASRTGSPRCACGNPRRCLRDRTRGGAAAKQRSRTSCAGWRKRRALTRSRSRFRTPSLPRRRPHSSVEEASRPARAVLQDSCEDLHTALERARA
jgi:hypothetical protein